MAYACSVGLLTFRTSVSENRLCPELHFKCSNGHCVHRLWVCDGKDDCGDNTDEDRVACGNIILVDWTLKDLNELIMLSCPSSGSLSMKVKVGAKLTRFCATTFFLSRLLRVVLIV